MNALHVLSILAVALSLVLARPNSNSLDLADILKKALGCPIEVAYDINEERIPRKIKILKCAQRTDNWCSANNFPREACCDGSDGSHVLECKDIRDTVLVFDKKQNKTITYNVMVGCACMIQSATSAKEVITANP